MYTFSVKYFWLILSSVILDWALAQNSCNLLQILLHT